MKISLSNLIESTFKSIISSPKEKYYIPEDIVEDVFEKLYSNSKSIDAFITIDSMLENELFFQHISAVDTEDKAVSFRCALKYVRQMKGDYISDFISNCQDKGIDTSICILSKICIEDMPPVSDFVIFDSSIVLALEHDINGGYYLSDSSNVLKDCENWLSFQCNNGQKFIDNFLQEPLMDSADMVSGVASVMCSHDHMNMESCYWYHSTWQYLRLLNLVSTPSWHHEFYLKNIEKALKDKQNDFANIFISGAADYSSLSYTIFGAKELNIDASFTVLDLCRTPLFSCEWYAKRTNTKLTTMQKSIFEFDDKSKYDLVCTDAFLTRFSKNDTLNILTRWYNALIPGGSVITTVRIHDDEHICPEIPLKEAVEAFANKAYSRAKLWGKHINCSPEEMREKAYKYASTMKSNSLGNKEDILNAFKQAGFNILHLEDVEVVGELYPSRYLRIYARRD